MSEREIVVLPAPLGPPITMTLRCCSIEIKCTRQTVTPTRAISFSAAPR